MSLARKSHDMSGLFEAEVLVGLMLRYWQHPLAEDREFCNELLERAAEVLTHALAGEKIMEDVEPANTNLIGAIWYAEWSALQGAGSESSAERQAWLDRVRRALPSCFCNPDELTP